MTDDGDYGGVAAALVVVLLVAVGRGIYSESIVIKFSNYFLRLG